MTVDLRRLDHFLAIAESGSINRAAETGTISQAGLTKSLRILEDQLGAKLFERGPRGAVLTRQGRAFHRHATLIANQRAAAVEAVRAEGEGVDVTIRIGIAPRWVLRTVLPPILARFAADERRPRVHVLSGRKSWEMIQSLREGELDCLVATPSELDDLEGIDARVVGTDPQGIVVRADHPLTAIQRPTLDDLGPYGWIVGPAETYFRRYIQSLYTLAGRNMPEPLITASSNVLILDTIARSDLLGIATRRLIEVGHGDRIAMLSLRDQVRRETAILTRTADLLPSTAHDLIASLAEALTDHDA